MSVSVVSPASGVRHCRPTLESLEGRIVLSSEPFFRQTNLVADTPGVAPFLDSTLKNAWGISLSPTGGAFWLSAFGTGISPLYVGDVTPAGGTTPSPIARPFAVTIPGGSPTGQVFNASNDFVVSAGGASQPARFIFASTTGIITGWNPAVPPPPLSLNAQVGFSDSQSQWTGLAIASTPSGNFLYAADFRNRTIDVFDKAYQPVQLAGNFVDPRLPRWYSPFNVQALGGKIYVAYAHRDNTGDGLPDGGSGFVSVFDTEGRFLRRLVSGNGLKQPYGMAIAPASWGPFAGALLVANHGNGEIHAFNPNTGRDLGELEDARGRDIRIDGLFGLAFGNGVSSGDKDALYFTAGPDDGAHGLFGSLRFVPGTDDDDDRGRGFGRSAIILGQGLGFSSGHRFVRVTAQVFTPRDLVFLDPSFLNLQPGRNDRDTPLAEAFLGSRSSRSVSDLVFTLLPAFEQIDL
jgi:uncharacterized protein (TIGR03118 family)